MLFKNSIDKYSSMLDEYGIPHKKSVIFDLLIKQADLFLQIGAPGFEYKRSDRSANVRFIGALLPANAKGSGKAWFDERLNRYKKVILVTQGTVEPDMNKLIIPTLEAFKGTDVLVIAATGGHDTSTLKERFPDENLIIEDYLSFDAVMPFVQVYVTNGGYGGVMLAIKHKLPVVAAGIHEGKSEICVRIGYFNYGINLNTQLPESQHIKAAVQEVLKNSLYRNNVSRLAAELNNYDSNSLCAEYIQELTAAI
ncbi:glycosyltransferase [Pedobacter hartonius]|uniref:glycosyltransferase n=1 Tax=Pedobacter hartonius TaxID=425514 RepID=UPI001C31874C|nr:hypothetical protein [Pedobacter hartonius]